MPWRSPVTVTVVNRGVSVSLQTMGHRTVALFVLCGFSYSSWQRGAEGEGKPAGEMPVPEQAGQWHGPSSSPGFNVAVAVKFQEKPSL